VDNYQVSNLPQKKKPVFMLDTGTTQATTSNLKLFFKKAIAPKVTLCYNVL
jgi:hypothetical protein